MSASLWFHAFLITVVIEVPIVVWLTAAARASWQKRALWALVAQILTHPLVWYAFPLLPRVSAVSAQTSFALSETWAWLAEAGLYAVTRVAGSPLRALGASAVANGASLGLGYFLL
jgi:hypothetical protein